MGDGMWCWRWEGRLHFGASPGTHGARRPDVSRAAVQQVMLRDRRPRCNQLQQSRRDEDLSVSEWLARAITMRSSFARLKDSYSSAVSPPKLVHHSKALLQRAQMQPRDSAGMAVARVCGACGTLRVACRGCRAPLLHGAVAGLCGVRGRCNGWCAGARNGQCRLHRLHADLRPSSSARRDPFAHSSPRFRAAGETARYAHPQTQTRCIRTTCNLADNL